MLSNKLVLLDWVTTQRGVKTNKENPPPIPSPWEAGKGYISSKRNFKKRKNKSLQKYEQNNRTVVPKSATQRAN